MAAQEVLSSLHNLLASEQCDARSEGPPGDIVRKQHSQEPGRSAAAAPPAVVLHPTTTISSSMPTVQTRAGVATIAPYRPQGSSALAATYTPARSSSQPRGSGYAMSASFVSALVTWGGPLVGQPSPTVQRDSPSPLQPAVAGLTPMPGAGRGTHSIERPGAVHSSVEFGQPLPVRDTTRSETTVSHRGASEAQEPKHVISMCPQGLEEGEKGKLQPSRELLTITGSTQISVQESSSLPIPADGEGVTEGSCAPQKESLDTIAAEPSPSGACVEDSHAAATHAGATSSSSQEGAVRASPGTPRLGNSKRQGAAATQPLSRSRNAAPSPPAGRKPSGSLNGCLLRSGSRAGMSAGAGARIGSRAGTSRAGGAEDRLSASSSDSHKMALHKEKRRREIYAWNEQLKKELEKEVDAV